MTLGDVSPDADVALGILLPSPDAGVFALEGPRLRVATIRQHREGGILLSGDAFHHTPKPDAFTCWSARLGRAPGPRPPLQHCVSGEWCPPGPLSLLDTPFDHVLPVHGLLMIGYAWVRFRPAVKKAAHKAT